MSVGVHRRQAVRRVVVAQGDHGELAALLVLALGRYRLVRVAVTKAKLKAADVTALNHHHAKGLSRTALATLKRHHQQLAVGHLGGAVVLLGQARDEVEIRLVEPIRSRHLSLHGVHRLPAIARGDISDDARQGYVFPIAAAGGLAAAAHVAGLTGNRQGKIGETLETDLFTRIEPTNLPRAFTQMPRTTTAPLIKAQQAHSC